MKHITALFRNTTTWDKRSVDYTYFNCLVCSYANMMIILDCILLQIEICR
jgi:hypothetical protein